MTLDSDLQSIQEARHCLEQANSAHKILKKMTQEQIDNIVLGMADEAKKNAGRLAAIAVEETGFGKAEHKLIKNLFAINNVYEAIKNTKTVGIIRRDEQNRVWEVAQPFGVIAGIVPSTNPTSTTIFKTLIALKSRNAIVFSPHPSAARCTNETVNMLKEAAERAGAPRGAIGCIASPTLASTTELMKHPLTDLILATGGSGLVKAAYSSGKPAYGVGPGNVPAYIHQSAHVDTAVRQIVESKIFDYGTICASEQAIVVDRSVKRNVVSALKEQGAYFLDDHDKSRVASAIVVNGALNPKIVGRSPQKIAEIAGIIVPADAKVLVAEETEVGKAYPFSVEKLSPILALYTVADWREGSAMCHKILEFGGLGHTLGIHCEDQAIIEAFGTEMPTSRIIVNSGTTFGGIGATTGIRPSMTLGCGSFGNNISSDNIGPEHLMNMKRVAFGIREMPKNERSEAQKEPSERLNQPLSISREEVMDIVKRVLQEMKL